VTKAPSVAATRVVRFRIDKRGREKVWS
jgi:hypothetical protein